MCQNHLIVISRFLERPQKQGRGNQLIHKHYVKSNWCAKIKTKLSKNTRDVRTLIYNCSMNIIIFLFNSIYAFQIIMWRLLRYSELTYHTPSHLEHNYGLENNVMALSLYSSQFKSSHVYRRKISSSICVSPIKRKSQCRAMATC